MTLVKPPSALFGVFVFFQGTMFFMRAREISGVAIAFLALLIAALHFVASAYYLYWSVWWFDILMHFLGGLFIGASALWLFYFEVPAPLRLRLSAFATAFAAVAAVGVSWEIFEKVVGAYQPENYTLDTTLDLAMDVVGMLAAYLIYTRLLWKNEHSH